MNREAIGIILIIFGWIGVISLAFTHNDNPLGSVVFSILAFGGAWFMLKENRNG